MTGKPLGELARIDDLAPMLEAYRAQYLGFFLEQFTQHRDDSHRGGYFNINSVTGDPYPHRHCYSWTDGRALGELCAAYLGGLGDRGTIRAYAEHLYGALLERYEVNGYFPHVVDDRTNTATSDPMNVPIGPHESSFSHVFVMNGLFQYALAFDHDPAWALADNLRADTEHALRTDRFLEGTSPRPKPLRAQGPFMITLGAVADALESMALVLGREFLGKAQSVLSLGSECISWILANHYRPADGAFWEFSAEGEAVPDTNGAVITDPGHTIEFTGFAARFARFADQRTRECVLETSRRIFCWAADRGFHPQKDLVYKHVDRDTGRPLKNERVDDIAEVVSPTVFSRHFQSCPGPMEISTFPWWVPMELIAAGGMLRHSGSSGAIDDFVLRAVRGLFEHYPSECISGLCYQNIGDDFFDYIDIPPATASLDLMHSHRSLRVFLREQDWCNTWPADSRTDVPDVSARTT